MCLADELEGSFSAVGSASYSVMKLNHCTAPLTLACGAFSGYIFTREWACRPSAQAPGYSHMSLYQTQGRELVALAGS